MRVFLNAIEIFLILSEVEGRTAPMQRVI